MVAQTSRLCLSISRSGRLMAALVLSGFVPAVDAALGKWLEPAGRARLALRLVLIVSADRLVELFSGVQGIQAVEEDFRVVGGKADDVAGEVGDQPRDQCMICHMISV